MERQFFSGNTIEQAVMAAARYYGLEPSRVAYRLRDKKHGFLNVRRRIVIEVDPSAPALAEESPAETAAPDSAEPSAPESFPSASAPPAAPPSTPSPSAAPPGTALFSGTALGDDDLEGDDFNIGDFEKDDVEDEDDFGEDEVEGDFLADDAPPDAGVWSYRKAVTEEFAEEVEEEEEEREIVAFEKALDEVLELMDLDVEWSVEKVEEGYEIDLEGRDEDLLVEDDGRLLRSIEHLLPRLVRGLLGYGLPCTVDSNDFHANRELELKELADDMAERARRQSKAQRLEPMNPADRRIVHLALADDPTVRTESEGEGYIKRVRILPA